MLRRYEFLFKSHSLFGNFKPITCAMNGSEIKRLIRFSLNLFSEATYVNVHRTRSDETAVAPYRIQQLIARKNTPGVARHKLQKPELACSDWDFLVADPQDHGAGVNFQVADLQQRAGGQRLSTAKYRPYTCHQLPRTERLGDVIIGSQVETPHPVHFRGFRGHEDDRHLRQER